MDRGKIKMVIKTKPYQHFVEIMPAALLSKHDKWQAVGQTLPCDTYFLIADPDNEKQIKLMRRLTLLFRQRGRRAGLIYLKKSATINSMGRFGQFCDIL